MDFEQRVHRVSPAGELLCQATVSAACLDADQLRPRPIPAHLFPR
jgi:acyl-CoA thioesterase FadM